MFIEGIADPKIVFDWFVNLFDMQSCKDERWRAMCKHLLEEVPQLLKNTNLTSTEHVIITVFASLPADIASFVKWIVEVKLAEDEVIKKVDRDETERLQYKVSGLNTSGVLIGSE